MYPEGRNGGTSTPGATLQRRSYFQSPVKRLKRKEQRTRFRQSACDRSTILTRVDRHGRCRESVPRVKRRKRRNVFPQAGADWETRSTLESAAATLAQISTRSAAHSLKSHQILVQKFAADRDRQKGRVSDRATPLAALAQNSTPSAAHFLKSHQLLVQKFAADRDRRKSSPFRWRAVFRSRSKLRSVWSRASLSSARWRTKTMPRA
jgi:hypothetical protein